MPYIHPNRRIAMSKGVVPLNAGELNYNLTQEVLRYVRERGGPNYGVFNDVLGVLTAMQHEIYRRLVAPYEDRKITENGDVFPTDR